MKRHLSLIVVVACVCGGVLLKYYSADDVPQSGGQSNQADVSAHSSPKSEILATRGHDDRDINFVPITGGKPRSRAPMDPFFRIPKSRNGLPLKDEHFVAESVQEQRWLDRNGYPNTQQMAAYSAASTFTLEQAAAHGDDVAAVMLAARQLAHGDPKAAGKLMTAGMNGSSYALSLLASYMAGAKHGNPELGYAVSRVVELRGDWRAGITRDFMFPVPLTPLQKARAEAEAIKILDNLRAHSPVIPYVDPRPPRPQTKG